MSTIKNNQKGNLERDLLIAIQRAENAAKTAEKAAKAAKKAAKKAEKARLKIKASKKKIISMRKTSATETEAFRDELIEIATKAAKRNKTLKKIAKLNELPND